ncbi:MAG: hypothetical protein AVDCRST_MAG64-2485 [uncultured Phycisphaerae bacterium]|uniref:Uncharacterized protein n=1 Tax=uncultured Phycisphaerae bacterium TaxID=904963 RepID=A0A6J4PIQ3_9BACT|nr:MAG: hypothetical protein AVDCRST_MAG64-2485 [uncultured Phycisphaerae bacterium]
MFQTWTRAVTNIYDARVARASTLARGPRSRPPRQLSTSPEVPPCGLPFAAHRARGTAERARPPHRGMAPSRHR